MTRRQTEISKLRVNLQIIASKIELLELSGETVLPDPLRIELENLVSNARNLNTPEKRFPLGKRGPGDEG